MPSPNDVDAIQSLDYALVLTPDHILEISRLDRRLDEHEAEYEYGKGFGHLRTCMHTATVVRREMRYKKHFAQCSCGWVQP